MADPQDPAAPRVPMPPAPGDVPPAAPVPFDPAAQEAATREKVREGLKKLAEAFSSGEKVKRSTTKEIRVPDGSGFSRTVTRMFLGNNYNGIGYYSTRTVPNTKKVRVPGPDVPVEIVFPSPGEASPSQVLEQFFKDNLYKEPKSGFRTPSTPETNPYLTPDALAARDRANANAGQGSMPILTPALKTAHDRAVANPTAENKAAELRAQAAVRAFLQPQKVVPPLFQDLADTHAKAVADPTPENIAAEVKAQSMAKAAYKLISEYEMEYAERVNRGENKDAVAFEIMQAMSDSRKGNVRIEGGAHDGAHLLVALARGNGTKHNHGGTTYDGSAMEMFNYVKAIDDIRKDDTNLDGQYIGGGYKASDAFAKFDEDRQGNKIKAPQAGYNPPVADRVSPDDIAPLAISSKEREAKLVKSLKTVGEELQGVAIQRQGSRYTMSPSLSGQSSPITVGAFLKKLGGDLGDETDLNTPDTITPDQTRLGKTVPAKLGDPKFAMDGMSYRGVDAFLPKAGELATWITMKKRSGDPRAANMDPAQLERDLAVVKDAIRRTELPGQYEARPAEPFRQKENGKPDLAGPKTLRENPGLTEAFQRVAEAIEVEYTQPPHAQLPPLAPYQPSIPRPAAKTKGAGRTVPGAKGTPR